jgi:hypothetical protein
MSKLFADSNRASLREIIEDTQNWGTTPVNGKTRARRFTSSSMTVTKDTAVSSKSATTAWCPRSSRRRLPRAATSIGNSQPARSTSTSSAPSWVVDASDGLGRVPWEDGLDRREQPDRDQRQGRDGLLHGRPPHQALGLRERLPTTTISRSAPSPSRRQDDHHDHRAHARGRSRQRLRDDRRRQRRDRPQERRHPWRQRGHAPSTATARTRSQRPVRPSSLSPASASSSRLPTPTRAARSRSTRLSMVTL